jgi:hypothetical protein
MTSRLLDRPRLLPLTILATAALFAGVFTFTSATRADADQHSGHHAMSASQPTVTPATTAKAGFHDQMRELWEQHVAWTRLAIVDFASGSAGFNATAGRLMQNQVDIGDAIKPFFGDAAGDQLTSLLHDHIAIAVEVLQAAKAGDTAAFNDANARWYANANDIADFLSAANPRSWPDAMMRDMMKVHLDQTLAEASDELHGNYAAGVEKYDAIEAHMLDMADDLSSGIISQFPSRFH